VGLRRDRFVVVEATRTHSNVPKPLHFAENAARFAPFADKIVHVVVDDMPAHGDAWTRENFQRNALVRGLRAAHPNDLVPPRPAPRAAPRRRRRTRLA